MLQCAILAGGLGTRMLPLTETLPKAMLPVAGRPFVEWQLELLVRQDVRRITICAGHLARSLRDHVGDGSRWGAAVTWIDEGETRLGTAGALRLALERGALDPAFFVLYGDSYLEVSMEAVQEQWRASDLPALMTVLRNSGRWEASNAIYREGRVIRYDKSRPAGLRMDMEWIDYGLSVLDADLIAGRVPQGAVADLAEVLRDLSLEGLLAGYEVGERFYEVGSAEGLADLEAHLGRRS